MIIREWIFYGPLDYNFVLATKFQVNGTFQLVRFVFLKDMFDKSMVCS